jgi:hypothetical protein
VTERDLASMLFSISSATAFMGLECESAMMVIAFQSSPILSLPRARAAPLPRSVRKLLSRAIEIRTVAY